MSQLQSIPADSPHIDHPTCPICGSQICGTLMWLARTSLDDAGHEWRTFECPAREIAKTDIVKID